MQGYTLVTIWHLEAPLERVWEILSHPEKWPAWWPYVEEVKLVEAGNPHNGEGSIHHHVWSTCLPYRLRFQLEALCVKPGRSVKARVSGDLVGLGQCRLRSCGHLTVVRFDWHVHTRRRWMNIVAPLARPVFLWNHQRVMAAGERSLSNRVSSLRGARSDSGWGDSKSDLGKPSRQAR